MMRNRSAAIFSVILACAAVVACGQDKTSGAGKDAVPSDGGRRASGTAGTAGQGSDSERESYQKKAEEKLRYVDEKIRTLTAGIERKGEAIRKETVEKTREMQERLKEKSRAAREKLDELKASGSEQWQSIKKDLDRMIGDLESAYHHAVSKTEPGRKKDH